MQLNPTGRIPTLIDGTQVIFESAAIALHLCEKHPEGQLLPEQTNAERALCYQWLFYLSSTLQPELMLYFYPEKHIQHSEQTANISGSTSANVAANIGANIKAKQEQRVTDMFCLLDKQLKNNTYLLGKTFSVCDPFLFMLCHWASEFSCPPLAFPELSRYLKNLAKRKAFQDVCARETTSLQLYQ